MWLGCTGNTLELDAAGVHTTGFVRLNATGVHREHVLGTGTGTRDWELGPASRKATYCSGKDC